MEKKVAIPMWVLLAFSHFKARKSALILIAASILFTIYCLPWSLFMPKQEWLSSVFLIDDWSWFAMMIPVVIWYWLSLRWMDKHQAWEE